jgi:hypothetical protein
MAVDAERINPVPVKGTYLALAGAGAILLWSGIKGKSWTDVLRHVVAGQSPAQAVTTAQITPLNATVDSSGGFGGGDFSGGGSGGTAPASGSLSKMLADLAHQFSWDASQVACWVRLIGMESNGPTDTNPSSGAFGWAQALGHGTGGTAGCGRNEYGGYGLSNAQAQQANCGNGPLQLLWMAHYVKATYGTPCNAVQFHLAHNYY